MVKGEVSKFQFRPLTIDDNLTRDGLEAVGTLVKKEPCYIVGGIATQSYLPTTCRRPTSDIDLSVVRPLNYVDFKTMVKPVEEYLKDYGYEIKEKKHSRAYKLEVTSENHDLKLLIEFSRRNQKSFEKSRSKLERELKNVRNKIVEGRHSTYTVASVEDIVVPKLARSINTILRRSELKRHIPKDKMSSSTEYMQRRLKFISEVRKEAMLEPTDLELAEKLRLVSDIYDIRILSEVVGLNEEYFLKVCKDWDRAFKKDAKELSFLKSILPDFL